MTTPIRVSPLAGSRSATGQSPHRLVYRSNQAAARSCTTFTLTCAQSRQHRHGHPLVAAEQDRPRDGRACRSGRGRRRARRRARRRSRGRTAARAARRRRRRGWSTEMPTSVTPCALDQRRRRGEQVARRRRGSSRSASVARGSVCERVARAKSSKRSRSTTVRPTRSAARMPPGDPVDERRRATASSSAGRRRRRRPSARCEPIERAATADLRPAAGRGCARARAGAARTPGRASRRAPPRSSAATSPTVRDAALAQLVGGDRPDAPQPLDRQRVEEVELAVGRHDEQPVGLGDAARDLGEELRAGDADGDRAGRPARSTSRRNRAAISTGVPGHAAQAADVEERLVDRDPLDERGRVARRSRTPPCSPRSTPTSAARRRSPAGTAARACRAAHRGADAEGLGLVAGGEHDAAADDHGPAAQPRVVALLDRRVEGVEVGVEDRRHSPGHEHMFAYLVRDDQRPSHSAGQLYPVSAARGGRADLHQVAQLIGHPESAAVHRRHRRRQPTDHR